MAAKPIKILIVDDEPAVREVLSLRIRDWGYEVCTAADGIESERLVEHERPDLVLLDLVLQAESGIDVLKRLQRRDPALPVILMTAHGNVDAAVEAMKEGAHDFLTKPLDHQALHILLESTAADLRHLSAVRSMNSDLDAAAGRGGLIGNSRRMRELFQQIELLASSDASAIIGGESGTGKEVAARAIHQLSARRDRPFVAVNAAAIPEGLIESEIFGHEKGSFTGATRSRAGCFELANGGTLLLDEVAEMPMALQPKLLRVLEDGRARRVGGSVEVSFDVRVLAATNRPPADAVKEGRLREDLYYRLNVFELSLPPLRERQEDLPLLAQHFVRQFNGKHGSDVEGVRRSTLGLLGAHPWRGNVRELRNVIERAVIVAGSGWIEPGHLPPYLQSREENAAPTILLPAGTTLAEAERELILRTLERVGNNKSEAARQLGLDVKTIRNKLKTYDREEAGS